jgi:TusA-related sulfurtransferase
MISAILLVAQMACADHVMGFPQDAAKHTFRLFSDGGAIEIRGTDPKTVEAIRTHLLEISKSFAAGDFTKPKAIHDRLPDGAAEMKQLRDAIAYRYEEIESGGRVRIVTSDPKALDAIHRFLRFQIAEHQTGDPTNVVTSPQ